MKISYLTIVGVPMHPQGVPQQQGPIYTDEDVNALKEMFPNMDEDVIR